LAGIKGNPEQLASIGCGESSSEFPRRHRCHRFDPRDRPDKALQACAHHRAIARCDRKQLTRLGICGHEAGILLEHVQAANAH
jgi:hypothetical protein